LIGLLERQEFDAARSNEAADGNAVALSSLGLAAT